jgi:hypothetical protein
MTYTNLLATTAMAVVLAAGAAAAQDLGSNSYSAGVSLLSPDQTGFLYAGTSEVTGLGSAAVVISAEAAQFNMTGFASSGIAPFVATGTGATEGPEAVANSGVLTTFDFDRTVTASASGIDMGRVVAQGDANAAVGAVGSAFGDTTSKAIENAAGGELASTSTATSESAASLVGEGSTSVLAGLIGTSSGFVGSTGTTVSSEQSGIAYSAMNSFGDKAGSGIDIAPLSGSLTTFSALSTAIDSLAAGKGAVGFSNGFVLGTTSTPGTIDLAVANVGGGTISLGASTGGFFGGGAATSGVSGYGSIFTAP